MKKVLKFLTSRLFVRCLIILIQLVVLFVLVYSLSTYSIYIQGAMTIMSLIFALALVNNDSNPMFKISWLIPILTFPVAGWIFYFVFERRRVSHKTEAKYLEILESSKDSIKQNSEVLFEIEENHRSAAKLFRYIQNSSSACVYNNTQTGFFSTGELFFKSYIEELKKAEKFIFIEYFIIAKGKMWNAVLDILKEKVVNGVEVRVMYDDVGTISLLDKNYHKTLSSYGIKTAIFNPFRASLDAFLNYRDHRKITVIDGNVAFTGGLNLADEYINKKVRFGYWKDCALILKGDAVSSMSLLFLQLWDLATDGPESDFKKYFSTENYEPDGYVQPFGDGPINGNLIGKLAYIGIINNAKSYVYIATPYLVLDNEMITALCLSAKSGIDVKIITPKIPDKWYVHSVTRSNYSVLIKAGVKIYEYSPGFIHSKTIVADDKYAIVGTANFDFRSFYLHFENGVFMYQSRAVRQVADDYQETLDESKEITLEVCNNTPFYKKILRSILRLFSPLM